MAIGESKQFEILSAPSWQKTHFKYFEKNVENPHAKNYTWLVMKIGYFGRFKIWYLFIMQNPENIFEK